MVKTHGQDLLRKRIAFLRVWHEGKSKDNGEQKRIIKNDAAVTGGA